MNKIGFLLKKNSFIKNILGFSLGPVISSLLGFITVPVLAWFFSIEDVGKISMLNTIISFGVVFFCLGGDQVYIREYHDCNNKVGLFKESIFPSSIFFLVVFIVCFYFSDDFLSLFLNEKGYTLFVVLCVFFQCVNRYFSLILRMNGMGALFSLSQILQKSIFVIIILIAILISSERSFSIIFYSLFFSSFISSIYVVFITRKMNRCYFSSQINILNLKRNLYYGLPFVPAGIAYWGLTGIDKIFLKEFSGLNELGLYSVSLSFASVATIFQSVFSIIWAPTVYKWKSKGEGLDKIPNILNVVTIIVFVIFCIVGAFSWISIYLLPKEYGNVQYMLITCMVPPLLYTLSEVTVVGIGITKKSYWNLIISLLAFFFNLILTYILVPLYGASGAAVSTALSFLLFFILRSEISSAIWMKIPMRKCYIYIIPCVLLACANSLYSIKYLYIIFWVGGLFFCLIINKRFLLDQLLIKK